MTAFGALIFATDYSVDPVTLAQALEQRGFESLFLTEHTHIPASRISPWPGGAELPKEYWHTHDPMVALAAAASATTTLKLGTGITLVTERDPILMAKQTASLDLLSNGRLLLGVGAGWNGEEMANHGVAYKDRWKVLRERVLAMRTIWREEEPQFHGEYVDFDPIWSYPKPKQPGGPPILLGASSRWTWDRIAEYGDGWFPIHQDPSRAAAQGALDYAAGIEATRQAWTRAGRSGEPSFNIFGVGPNPGRVAELIDLGFDRIIFGLPSADADTVMPLLDKLADLAFRQLQ
ncbi:MAG: TIGR03619 family F420-dependent LLM class oxidoreductase [Pseudomonadales bacterium]